MRVTKPIEITMRIPLPVDKPDGNGIVYPKDILEKAYNDITYCPLVFKGKENYDDVVIGVINNAKIIEENKQYYAIVSGVVWNSGTSERISFDKTKISSMEIQDIGFGVNTSTNKFYTKRKLI